MSKMDDLEKQLIDEPQRNKSENSLLSFFMGLLCFGAGIFMVFQATDVRFVWYSWRFGGLNIPTGFVIIPLLIGIGLLFYNSKSIISWVVTILGLIIVLLTIIMSVTIAFRTTSLFMFVLMFGFILAGAGLLLRALFTKPKKQ